MSEPAIERALADRARRVRVDPDGWQDLGRRLASGGGEPDEPGLARRITAGVVAFAVFAGAGFIAWRAFGTEAGPPPATERDGYPEPPDTGYWIIFPDMVTPVEGDTEGAVTAVALTNLPDGTRFELAAGNTGTCCPEVQEGRIAIRAENDTCYGRVGAIGVSPGVNITVTVTNEFGVVPGGLRGTGSTPPEQPPDILRILGDRFQELVGEQVVEREGVRELIAEITYRWPEPQCGGEPFPLFGGTPCPDDGQLQGDGLEEAMAEVMGAIGQARICELWGLALPPSTAAEHPWIGFAERWRAWLLDPPKDFADDGLDWSVREHTGDRYEIDVTDDGVVIAELTLQPLPDHCPGCGPNVVPFWGLTTWTLR